MVAHNHKPVQWLLTIYQLQSCWLLLCVWFTQPSWRWRQYISPKRRYTHARLHGVTPHCHHRDNLRYRLIVFKWRKSTFSDPVHISRWLSRTQDSSLVACDAVSLGEWYLVFGGCVVASSSGVGHTSDSSYPGPSTTSNGAPWPTCHKPTSRTEARQPSPTTTVQLHLAWYEACLTSLPPASNHGNWRALPGVGSRKAPHCWPQNLSLLCLSRGERRL